MRFYRWVSCLIGVVGVVGWAAFSSTGRREASKVVGASAPPIDAEHTDPRRTPLRQLGERLVHSWASQPVVDVPPESTPTTATAEPPVPEVDAAAAAEERDREVLAIRATGPDSSGLLAKAQAIGHSWEDLAKEAGVHVEVEPWECHRTGCFAAIVHPSSQAAEQLTSGIFASEELANWGGSETRSAPVRRPDGSVELTWFFIAGEDGGGS
jgi:hypothetical protein